MGVIDTLMMNCRKASVLIEQRQLRKLDLFERVSLRFHLGICDGCKAYEKQSALIDRWLEQRRDRCAELECEELKQRIMQRVDLKL